MKKINNSSRWKVIHMAIYAVMVALALACVLIIVLSKSEVMNVLAQNTLGAIIGAGVIDILIESITKNQKEEDLSSRIISALCPEECAAEDMPMIYDLYNKDTVAKFMRNSIKAYTCSNKLSDAYLSYIEHSFHSVKMNENYVVTISNMDGIFHIDQDLKDTFIFVNKDEIDVKVFIVLGGVSLDKGSESRLDAILSDKSYIFREEISNVSFVKKKILPYLDDKQKLLEAIDFRLSIFNKEDKELDIPPTEIDVEPVLERGVCLGIGICYHLYNKHKHATFKNRDTFILNQNVYSGREAYIRLTTKVHIGYPIPENQNHFHLVYSRPTIAPSFSLIFQNIPDYSPKKVVYLPMLSFDSASVSNKAEDGQVHAHASSFEFSTSRIIFPRSGISFYWNFRKELPRIEQNFMDYGLVNVNFINPDIDVLLMYSTEDNFLHNDLYNEMERAYFVPEIALMLSSVQNKLSEMHPGWRLRILDAARPWSVQKTMYEFAKKNGQQRYVANPSVGGFHNYGLAVDLTILDNHDKPLDMGCPFDTFNETAHFGDEDNLVSSGAISQQAADNRRMLHDLMVDEGFTHNPFEWWHFQKYTIDEAKHKFRLLDF